MPTPVNPTEKANFIAIVNVVNPQEAGRLVSIFVNYEDLQIVIGRQQNEFAANNQYLIEAVGTLNSTAILAAGVYFNGTQGGTITNPVMFINYISSGTVVFSTNTVGFGMFGSSKIADIVLSTNIKLQNLYIGPGSALDIFDGSASGTMVNRIYLPFLRSNPSSLNVVKYGSSVGEVIVGEGSYYGGVENIDPQASCLIPVTSMIATEVTKNGILVSWTPPASGYLFINPFYRKTNSKVWILCTDQDGEFVDNTGFIFRNLESDTYYDFKATVICNNGGATSTTITTRKTLCCGAGTQLSIYKTCQITILIKTSPNIANTQTLCNGVIIAKEYPIGTTITVPYLAGINANILQPFVIDNANYQNMPYDASTGTWDASTTSVVTFIDGNVVTVNVNVPA